MVTFENGSPSEGSYWEKDAGMLMGQSVLGVSDLRHR